MRLSSPWPLTSSQALSTATTDSTVLGLATGIFLVNSSTDDINVDGNDYESRPKIVWIGTGKNSCNSWTGLRFTCVVIPRGAKITSAKIMVYSTSGEWITLKYNIYGEDSGNVSTFCKLLKPSQRKHTSEKQLLGTMFDGLQISGTRSGL